MSVLSIGLRFHDLRHSYAMWLVSDGVPVNEVAKVMSHEKASATINRYTHSTGERDRRVRGVVGCLPLPGLQRTALSHIRW
ncbi:tyrosine-type recombinase/integrase [Micromonospora carbonacea]|uniref:tyrosine-type recombinase/integrase n=1 Tax=Micromonospora carbonacea TaxID=47853 RepID=UPI00332DE8E0